MFAKSISVSLIAAAFVLAGCPVEPTSNVACDRIYKECSLSLLNADSSPMDYGTCQTVLEIPENVSFANCFAAAACGNMSVSCPPSSWNQLNENLQAKGMVK